MNLGRRDFLKAVLVSSVSLIEYGCSKSQDTHEPEVFDYSKPKNKLEIIDYSSPKRKTRPNRKSTDYIILHNTETSNKTMNSTLRGLSERGEANYLIDANGNVYRIMKPLQLSYGCGRSMWNGRTNIDEHAFNIEFMGFYVQEPTDAQYSSAKELLKILMNYYKIRDEDVMPHSQVAYGVPNKWQEHSHRGRKRCGMLFAKDEVRKKLGLIKRQKFDPDVREGRLVVDDKYLNSVLYDNHNKLRLPNGQEYENDVELGRIKPGEPVWNYAGNEFDDETTVYIFPDSKAKTGKDLADEDFDFNTLPSDTLVAVRYNYGGIVSDDRTPWSMCGNKWNLPSTFYVFPSGKLETGDDINDNTLPNGTHVLFRD